MSLYIAFLRAMLQASEHHADESSWATGLGAPLPLG